MRKKEGRGGRRDKEARGTRRKEEWAGRMQGRKGAREEGGMERMEGRGE